jgi:predicted RNA-binding Zn-ribbon protein involved in translation (DUF1610 family)
MGMLLEPERPHYQKCHECGMKVPLTAEQYHKLEGTINGHRGMQICPNCGEEAYQSYSRDPMGMLLEVSGKAVLNGTLGLIGRLVKKLNRPR